MKKAFLILILFLNVAIAFGNPNVKCIKKYPIGVEKAYISAYSVLNNCKYDVLEIQSENGYILFNAGGREFLLEASPRGAETLVKITPVDSNMSDLSVQENIFKMMDSEILKVK